MKTQSIIVSSPSTQYRLYEQVLGRGSYAVVLLAKNLRTQVYHAIKIVQKEFIYRSQGMDNIRQEILVQSKLNHQNVLKLIETFEDSIYIYLVTEYCPKGSLYDLIYTKGQLSESQTFQYFDQILSAVQYMHSKGIMHRDIKLSNILLTKDNQIKLCDFNWAADDTIGSYTGLCGTLEYMPPEVYSTQNHSQKLDIWSLGVVLYVIFYFQIFFKEMLHKQLPIINNLTFQNISKECQYLLEAMLSQQPYMRPTCKQIQFSQWFKVNNSFNHKRVNTEYI